MRPWVASAEVTGRPVAAALLPGQARRIDEDGAQDAGFAIEIQFQLLVPAGRVGEGVNGAVDGLLFVVGRALALGLAEQFAGVGFLPLSDLLLAVGGDFAPNFHEWGRLDRSAGHDGRGDGRAQHGVFHKFRGRWSEFGGRRSVEPAWGRARRAGDRAV